MEEQRAQILAQFGASPEECVELLRYNENRFHVPVVGDMALPPPDESFVLQWSRWAGEVERAGTLRAIYPWIPQFQFSIREDVTPVFDCADGLQLERPDQVTLRLHSSAAGRIPVLTAATRADFVSLTRALAHKGEPVPIPISMGAVMISGLGIPSSSEGSDRHGTAALAPHRIILLGCGPYSGVAAESLGLTTDAWLKLSHAIRLEHECAHYFTRSVFGSMRNRMHDEIVADYCGIVGATGVYNAQWALQFLGLRADGGIGATGRMRNYRGQPALSDGAFQALACLTAAVIANVECFDQCIPTQADAATRIPAALFTLCAFSLEEMAQTSAAERMLEHYLRCDAELRNSVCMLQEQG